MPRINRKSYKRSNKRRSNNKQRGGKAVLPAEYFNPTVQGNYVSHEQLNETRDGNVAVSHGVSHGENMNSVGPDLHAGIGLNNQTGGGLPMKYFNGSEDSNAGYFASGSPELESCTSPYGQLHPTSHGVVLDAPGDATIDAQGLWMGPQLAAGPGGTGQTGGARNKKLRARKNKRSSKKLFRKKFRSKSNSNKRKSKRNSKRRNNKRKN
jgi:hypothetical protein